MARKSAFKRIPETSHKNFSAGLFRDIILGGQDGLVNVLGIVLGLGGAAMSSQTIIISGLVATAAESISMAAVAYTSTRAARDFYESQLAQETKEIRNVPKQEVSEVKEIYYRKGFRGQLLNKIVNHVVSDKKLWLDTMMTDELGLLPTDYKHPLKDAVVVGFASIIGSLVPVLPFFFFDTIPATVFSLAISSVVLFGVGNIKARLTIGKPWRAGLELMVIGILAALAGYGIGRIAGLLL